MDKYSFLNDVVLVICHRKTTEEMFKKYYAKEIQKCISQGHKKFYILDGDMNSQKYLLEYHYIQIIIVYGYHICNDISSERIKTKDLLGNYEFRLDIIRQHVAQCIMFINMEHMFSDECFRLLISDYLEEENQASQRSPCRETLSYDTAGSLIDEFKYGEYEKYLMKKNRDEV
jgi:hypothetical protein